MTTDRAFALLRRENPVHEHELPAADGLAASALRERILSKDVPWSRPRRPRAGRGRVATAAAALTLTAAVVALLVVGSPGGGPAVEDAAAAVKRAAAVTAVSAERSGTAVVRITHGGDLWAASTIRWHDGDLSVSQEAPRRAGSPGAGLLLVDGIMYGVEDDGWIVLGSPKSIDPGSGTTPDEYLAAVREDVGGVTLRRITSAMTGLTTSRRDDGTTVYGGSVAAGLVARKSGFKEGRAIRLLPFGYVAHDEAADPAAPLEAAVTVGADRIVRSIAVTWGTSASAWAYTVDYSGLGATPALAAPANARPLRRGAPARG